MTLAIVKKFWNIIWIYWLSNIAKDIPPYANANVISGLGLKGHATGARSVYLTWELYELETKDIIEYKVSYSLDTKRGLNTTYSKIHARFRNLCISGLYANSDYVFKIQAVGDKKPTRYWSYTVKIRTKEGKPSPVRQLTWAKFNATTVKLSWLPPEKLNGVLRRYNIHYNYKKAHNKPFGSTALGKSDHPYFKLQIFGCAFYSVSVSAVTGAGKGEEVILNFKTPALDGSHCTNSLAASHATNSIEIIIVGIIVLVVIVARVMVLFLLMPKTRKRNTARLEPVYAEVEGMVQREFNNTAYAQTPSLVFKDENGASTSCDYMDLKNGGKTLSSEGEYAKLKNLNPFNLTSKNYEDVVKNLEKKDASGKLVYQKTFELLQKIRGGRVKIETKNGQKEANKEKNRYQEILPNDECRVVLRGSPYENIETDYINAVFVQGFNNENAYIATQYPLPETMYDFRVMLSQQNVKAVVVLSDIKREKKVFPSKLLTGSKYAMHGDMVTKTLKMADMKIEPYLKVASNKDNGLFVEPTEGNKANAELSEECQFFHIRSWPNHGIPRECLAVVDVAYRLRDSASLAKAGKSPIVVMCSDGAGRSGCFITIMMALECLFKEGSCNIMEVLNRIRCARPEFVENEEQFMFCYEAVAFYLEWQSKGNYINVALEA